MTSWWAHANRDVEGAVAMRALRPIVLCYHAISASWNTSLAVPLDRFEVQLRRLADRGYVGLTFEEAERRRQAGTLPPRALVVTFDDAFASIASARPVLRELGFPATVFVVGDFLESQRPLDWPGIEHWKETEHRSELRALLESELLELQDEGWEIGSHTMSHPSLPDLDDDDCLRELIRSRQLITERFGACSSVAYPYGRADTRVASLAARAGYAGGCTLTYSHVVDEPLRRPRVAVSGTDSGPSEWAKMTPLAVRLRRTPLASLLARL
jgi:peptidoglycan/xylan/chitin deacetylase (PgdA/CDA1 family)